MPDDAGQGFGDEDEAAAGQHGEVDPGESGDGAAPGARGVHHVRGVDVAGGGAYAADRSVRAGEEGGDLLTQREADPVAGGVEQPCGGVGGHHLGVLGVVEAAGESGCEMGLQVVEPVGRDLVRDDAGFLLAARELPQGVQSRLAGGDDETALGLVLDGRR